MDEFLNQIVCGDCIEKMRELPKKSIDLAFADPPFNIGYDYDVYDDRVEYKKYLNWSRRWISEVSRVLKPNGTFWLAIGDEYAAELKIQSQEIGFHCRSWVVWYYTFGVNCSKKFTRSHAHLFQFVKNSDDFTFRENDLDNRVPSARELVYNDKRANPRGRLPDDTWIIRPADAIGELVPDDSLGMTPELCHPPADNDQTFTLRPQDLDRCFQGSENTWYFPRVAGTFKERAGFHGCQMPEQLLGRIIRTCSNLGDVVLDPFSGSATTLAVAKKLGRRFIGFDVSKEYVQYGVDRLKEIRVGDRLDGSPEPLKSAPQTHVGRNKKSRESTSDWTSRNLATEMRYVEIQRELTERGIIEAFQKSHDGFSPDRVVTDPGLNGEFADACTRLGLAGDLRIWNTLLFRLRKSGRLSHIKTTRRTTYDWQDCDDFLYASEIAWQIMLNDQISASLDEILCDPQLTAEFERRAQRFASGFTRLEYCWAALKLRKEAKKARTRAAALLVPPKRFREVIPLNELASSDLTTKPGVYLLCDKKRKLYAGETLNLQNRLRMNEEQLTTWEDLGKSIVARILPMESLGSSRLACQSYLVNEFKPQLNCSELRSAS
jgi:site-specific DNA-methyltransferase (adenine-specific)